MMADSTVTKAAAAQLWKLPPIIKIYEAAGAIGDGRLELIDETRATVTSSDGAKTYEVAFDAAARTVAANDNASYWQGYLGYPGIAMLLLRGVLEVSRETAAALRGIAWKELNRRFKNDYARTLAAVDEELARRGSDPAAVRAECERLLETLRVYAPMRGVRRRPP